MRNTENLYIIEIADVWGNRRTMTVKAERKSEAITMVIKRPGEYVSAVMEVA